MYCAGNRGQTRYPILDKRCDPRVDISRTGNNWDLTVIWSREPVTFIRGKSRTSRLTLSSLRSLLKFSTWFPYFPTNFGEQTKLKMAHKTGTLNEAQARLEHKMAVNRDYIFQPRMCKYFDTLLSLPLVGTPRTISSSKIVFQLQPIGLCLV